MVGIYFQCADCGKRVRIFDGVTFKFQEERETKPLRAVVNERKRAAGRELCEGCWKRFLLKIGNPGDAAASTGATKKRTQLL